MARRRPQQSSIRAALEAAGDYANLRKHGKQSHKKNFAQKLSTELAQRIGDALRVDFPTILPSPDRTGHESEAPTARGMKRLDVNYSTPKLGLALGISIKTVNFRDGKTKRYTKNFKRADGELRAEASDYHERQPYSALIALVFMPKDACDDGASGGISSFGHGVVTFRARAGRERPSDPPMLFERVFIGLYETEPENFGDVVFFDVMDTPKKRGLPKNLMDFDSVLNEIVKTFNRRNAVGIEWDDGTTEEVTFENGDEGDDGEDE